MLCPLYTATGVSGTLTLPSTHRRYRLALTGNATLNAPGASASAMSDDLEIILAADGSERTVTMGSGFTAVGSSSVAVPAGGIRVVEASWDGSAWLWVRT